MTVATERHPLVATVEDRFAGKLTNGSHLPDGAACLLEAVSIARGLDWTDDPARVKMPDLRGLNDAPWSSDKARTTALLPVGVALWDWADWPLARHQAFAKLVAERTIREVVPLALLVAAKVHPDFKHAKAMRAAARVCVKEGTVSAVSAANATASAAWSAASAVSAAWSTADAAANAAVSAAWSAASAVSAAWSTADAAANAAVSAAWSTADAAASAASAWSAWSAESAAVSAAWSAASAVSAASAADKPLIVIARILVESAEASRVRP